MTGCAKVPETFARKILRGSIQERDLTHVEDAAYLPRRTLTAVDDPPLLAHPSDCSGRATGDDEKSGNIAAKV